MFSFLEEFHYKIVEITQGFNLEEQREYLKTYSKNEIPTFIFAGSFVPIHRDPTLFLEYIVNLDIDYKFHLYTRQKWFVEPFIEKSKGRIELHDYLTREDLIGELSTMDFIVNFMYDPYKYAPSKMADYLIAGRPVLNIDYELDKDVINEFLKGNYEGQFNMFTLDRFDIKNIVDQFLFYYNEASCKK